MTSESVDLFFNTIQEISKEKVKNWWDIVTSMMGSNSEATLQWNNIFITRITELYDGMIDEAIQKRNDMQNKIEELLKQSSHLCKNLNIHTPHYGSRGLTLYEEQEYLIKKIKKYEEEVESIKKEIKKLNKEELSLTKSLGRAPQSLPLEPLPSPDTISKFRKYLEQLESTRFEREEHFLNIKAEILDFVEDLNYEPTLDFERMVIDDSVFVVSDNNMKNIEEFLNSLKLLSDDIKKNITNLRKKVKSLWDLLDEDLVVRDEFFKKTTKNNKNTLRALQQEVTRIEHLKKAHIEVFVTRLRNKLASLWDKCHYTEEQRNDFEYFTSDTCNQDLLDIYEFEIKRVAEYYENNSTLYKLLEKRSDLWNRMVELEENASMPGRFKNRGGKLLKEEKERNALLKRLPKMEEQMMLLAEEFELEHKKPFYSWGKTVKELITESHNMHEEDKKLKLSASKEKRDRSLTPCKMTFGSTLNLPAHTPLTGTKRKLASPGAFSSSKKILGERHNNAITKSAPSKLARLSIERAKRIEKSCRTSRKKLEKQLQKENVCAECDMFEGEIGSKGECKSTTFSNPEDETVYYNAEDQTVIAISLPLTP